MALNTNKFLQDAMALAVDLDKPYRSGVSFDFSNGEITVKYVDEAHADFLKAMARLDEIEGLDDV